MRFACALLLSAAPLFAAAQPASEPVSAAEARAVRNVIEAQLDAFQKDDAERAFSYATPAIREQFGTPEHFIAMVRIEYAVVYRPRTVAFRAPRRVGEELVQPVRMTDSEGHPWLVVYPMERQPDGNWRINGCEIAKLPGQET